ncbi:MAG: hypothetical protein OEX02_01035 [Cyclobacteriaceae bacterium]|nr:hypothetical protein [Cyclobacteriaceae bacterium]
MAKLKNIIKQLSEKDYKTIETQLLESNADKSAYLLSSMRERQLSDNKIMEELDVNTNAYYTLRSRLNQKIEEYLLEQIESPRTDILKKVVNINEVVFTKKKAIAIATLKKLEKELLDYDLSNELTTVYKYLKKLNINSPDYYNYSQLYNRHVAYTLAIDKAEDLLAEYFKKYGLYIMTGDESVKMGLSLFTQEMSNISDLYESHRLYVYESCMVIFHRLFVESSDEMDGGDDEPIEDKIDRVTEIFDQYPMDSIYYHLNLVFEFLKLEYYNHYKVYRKAEKYFEEVNDAVTNILTNYSQFTFPGQFLDTKIKRHLRLGLETEMYEEDKLMFEDYEPDMQDTPKYLYYVMYRALSCYYAGNYNESARWINNLLNEVSLKKYPLVHLEIKVILALQYCLLNDYDLFNQLINSIQRQIRILGKENCEHISLFSKMLKISISEVKQEKAEKIKPLIDRFNQLEIKMYAPTTLIRMDEEFINKLG